MSMECHVDANPGAEISWFKDGEFLLIFFLVGVLLTDKTTVNDKTIR